MVVLEKRGPSEMFTHWKDLSHMDRTNIGHCYVTGSAISSCCDFMRYAIIGRIDASICKNTHRAVTTARTGIEENEGVGIGFIVQVDQAIPRLIYSTGCRQDGSRIPVEQRHHGAISATLKLVIDGILQNLKTTY